jgi:heat shock protein HslJ
MKRLIILLLTCIGILESQAQISYFLSNKFWRLKQATIHGREYQLAGNSNAPTLQFSGGSIRGNGGCNAYHTKFTINGNSLHIDKIMSTRMSCNSLELEETEYFNAMAQSHTLEYEEGSNEFRLLNTSNDMLVFYSQFERTQSSYSPPPSPRRERTIHYADEDEVRPALSKKQNRRKADLERKMKRGKLSKAERRELIKLQSKAKKGKVSKGKKGKSVKGKKGRKGKVSKKSRKAKGKGKTSKKSKKKRR